jgi:hypothetical protein
MKKLNSVFTNVVTSFLQHSQNIRHGLFKNILLTLWKFQDQSFL